MTMESVFWIASCTKMIGGIACMQLVEQGKLSLDDADLAAKICPEFNNVQICDGFQGDGTPILRKPTKRITLRKLLSHTAGFGYTFFSEKIRRAGLPAGFDEFSGLKHDIEMPLLFEPGDDWEYGVNIDWAGLMVERVTGLCLNDYFLQHIFAPLGIKNVTMFPNDDMKSKLAYMHERNPQTGKLQVREHLLRRPLVCKSKEDEKLIFNSAGAGCFAQPTEYTKLIATLLNDGTSPLTGKQILKKETVDEMFSNQIPEMPNFGRKSITAVMPHLTNSITELYPQPHDQAQGWGLTFMLTIQPGATGRGANTGWWAGLPNLFWWADRERGVGGIVASQIIPFADASVMGLWAQVESMVYAG